MCTTCGCGSSASSIYRPKVPAAPKLQASVFTAVSTVSTVAQQSASQSTFAPHRPHSQRESATESATGTVHQHLEIALLQRNDDIAADNRELFARLRALALNLVSSPGAGKTTLLEKTLHAIARAVPVAVIEGDQATDQDAQRIAATGVKVVQVNTGTGCHLDADMIRRAAQQLQPLEQHLLLIENVGNLVCPALFDLGEKMKVVLLSVTEGDDKPLKYPHMFQAAGLLLITKTDLLPHVDFDVDACVARARQINPRLEVLQLSARTGQGMDTWHQWLQDRLSAAAKTGY